MIFFDHHGYPCDQTGDVGDSAVRAALLKVCGSKFGQFNILDYEIKPGIFVRHPLTPPWNNSKNFTRDQMMCLIAGLVATGNHAAVKRMFYASLKRCFFSQSFERDWPGTRKYPWPHIMRGGDPVDEGKLRWFDFADLLFPNHIGCMILGGRVHWAYLFLPISYIVHFIFMAFQSNSKEQNQMFCESYVLRTGFKVNQSASFKYWASKKEAEYHQMIMGS